VLQRLQALSAPRGLGIHKSIRPEATGVGLLDDGVVDTFGSWLSKMMSHTISLQFHAARRGPAADIRADVAVGLQLGDAVELILGADCTDSNVQWTTRTTAGVLALECLSVCPRMLMTSGLHWRWGQSPPSGCSSARLPDRSPGFGTTASPWPCR
jgi:hypothetical protein